jgi:hypothetical protein
MRNLISLVLVLFATNVFAATGSGNVSNVLTLGGVSNLGNLVIPEANSQGYFALYTSGVAITSGNVAPLYKNGVAYQVTAAKTFKTTKICVASGAAPVFNYQLITATASFAANATTASLTGPVYQSGAAGGYSLMNAAAAGVYTCFDATFDMAASTYAGYQSNSTNNSVIVIGKEI